MCGIAGLAGMRPDQQVLNDMAAAVAHRGPDSEGFLVDGDAGLAFRRLSIIDLTGGNQPIYNEDESVAIVLNGEIYNYRELKAGLLLNGHSFRTRSDAETVLHLWEEKGADCLQDLRGMFALAIWDRREHALFLARDRVGKKPLYYTRLPSGALVFGSEIKAILQHPAVPREVDLNALDHFLTLQYIPSPWTAFRSIYRLPPGHWLRWRDGKVEVQRYWRLQYEPKHSASEAELGGELLRLAREAVSIRMESEVPLGAFLSGGIDSSAVVAFASQAMSAPLKTFSIGFSDASIDESPYARIVAKRFRTDHHELMVEAGPPELIDDIVWHYDQPFGDSSAIPSFLVARITRSHVTVVLNGDGGDESFAGYDRYQLSSYAPYFHLPLPARLLVQAAGRPLAKTRRRAGRLFRGSVRDPYDAYFSTVAHLHPAEKRLLYDRDLLSCVAWDESPPLAYMHAQSHRALLDSYLDTDVNNYLPDDLLVKMDVATMAHGLEARSPFLDHRLMEFMARVPANLKLRRGESKRLLKSALRGILPEEILSRKKMGFAVPLGEWLRGSYRELMLDTLLSDRAMQRGYFKAAQVRMMVEAQLSGSDRYQYVLWDLLMLERWHRMFIDSKPVVRQAATASA